MSRTPESDWVVQALERHERPLIRYAKCLLGDVESARDVVQETFLRLCREDRDRVEGHLAPWLFTVCRNLALDTRKKAVRMASIDTHEFAVASDLDERYDAQTAAGRIREAIAALPPNQREVVHLKFQCDLSYKEISQITSLSVSNVGFLLHTAVRAIRAHVGADATGAGHEYAPHQSQRSEVDGLRTGRARRG
jgi:RNA polymerase sigma-70 factor (ECF subfamily)